MVGKKQIKLKLENSGQSMWAFSDVLNEAYIIIDSVGKCKDCKLWSKEYQSLNGSIGICRNEIFELKKVDTLVREDFYCGDFDRCINETN